MITLYMYNPETAVGFYLDNENKSHRVCGKKKAFNAAKDKIGAIKHTWQQFDDESALIKFLLDSHSVFKAKQKQ